MVSASYGCKPNYSTLEHHQEDYLLPEDFLSETSFCNYCKGTPEKDVHYWNEWLKVHPQQASPFHEAERMFRMIGAYDSGFEDAMARFSDELYALPAELPVPRKKTRSLNVRYWAAAAVVLVAGASLFLLTGQPAGQLTAQAPAYDTVETGNAKVRRVMLEDGTFVTLNSHSRLLVPNEYNKQKRKVLLEGEAFFDVKTDAERPFSVESNGVETQVLGTSFNVQAYRQRATVRVTVLSGLVVVKAGKEPAVKVRPDQQLLINNDGSAVLAQVQAKPYRMWTEGELNFNNESLEDIAFTLGMYYDTDIVFEDNDCRKELFTASFEKGTKLNKVLELLSFGRNIRFSQKGNTIMIGRAGN